MHRPRLFHVLIAGGVLATAITGCGDDKIQRDSVPSSAASPNRSPAPENAKPVEPVAPTTATSSPAVIDQPAAPTATPTDAAKDKTKAGAGEVKKETPPSGH